MDDSIRRWIDGNIRMGYSDSQIKAALQQANLSPSLLDEFKMQNGLASPTPPTIMPPTNTGNLPPQSVPPAGQDIPIGAKISSVLYSVKAAGWGWNIYSIYSATGTLLSLPVIGAIITLLTLPFALLFGGMLVFYIFIAKGIWRGESWSRTSALVFSWIGFVFGILFLIVPSVVSIIFLLINCGILYFLMFDRETKSYCVK